MVIAIIMILSSVGIASYTRFSRTQTLTTTTLELVNSLQEAKSRTLSQLKISQPPSGSSATCDDTQVFGGYAIVLIPPSSYELRVKCGTNVRRVYKHLFPAGVTYNTLRTFTTIQFNPLQALVTFDNNPTVTFGIVGLSGLGENRKITLDAYGNFSWVSY